MGVEVIDKTWGGAWAEESVGAWTARPSREWEAWAEELTRFPPGGLERAAEDHERQLRVDGWRYVSEEWKPPARQRRSVEQAGEIVRRAVQRLDPRSPPPYTIAEITFAAVGIFEALADLLFYPTALEAWRESTPTFLRAARRSAIPWVQETFRAVMTSLRRGASQNRCGARFANTGHLLEVAEMPADACRLGAGAPSYQVAESRGRTRARWDEVACKVSHTSSGSVKQLSRLEAVIDAQKAIERAGVDHVDRFGLEDWLVENVSREERVRRYRRRLAAVRGHGIRARSTNVVLFGSSDPADCVVISDAAAATATADVTDREILARLTRARAALERSLRAIPEKADALAMATGDRSFLAPLVPPAKPKAWRHMDHRRQRQPIGRIESCAPRWT